MPKRGPASIIAMLLLQVLMTKPAAAQAGEAAAYALDPVHTRVMFAVEHAGFSKALGTISGSTGSILFDPDDWSSARLDVRVPLTQLDLGDARWNTAVLARKLLDGERFPDARFIASAAEPVAPGQARVCGELTLRDVTRPLCMDVTVNAIKRHPLPPFRRTAGFSATANLSRAEFGIDAWPSVIGDAVELRIEAEAVRDDDAAAAFAPVDPAGPAAPAVDPEVSADGEAAAVPDGPAHLGPLPAEPCP